MAHLWGDTCRLWTVIHYGVWPHFNISHQGVAQRIPAACGCLVLMY